MSSQQKTIVIFGGARDYHAMHWYRAVRTAAPDRTVLFLTDLIAGEGFEKIANADDDIHTVFVIDGLLMTKISKVANIWRNFVKLAVLPLQAYLLRRFLSNHPSAIVHAHPMYYMLVCLVANVEYVGRPQGSEILVRPRASAIYRYFARLVLKKARYVTVDSKNMSDRTFEISGVRPLIVPNGIDLEGIRNSPAPANRSTTVLSLRGIAPLYRIEQIIQARDRSSSKPDLAFIYPFFDEPYLKKLGRMSNGNDQFHGRLSKDNMFTLLKSTKLAVSIPSSDSSPRTVYEAIFAGCCVAVTYNQWIDGLPTCMRDRIFIVNLESATWFDEAVSYADALSHIPFAPSPEANEMFDLCLSIARVVEKIY
jgi:hypothetical protein